MKKKIQGDRERNKTKISNQIEQSKESIENQRHTHKRRRKTATTTTTIAYENSAKQLRKYPYTPAQMQWTVIQSVHSHYMVDSMEVKVSSFFITFVFFIFVLFCLIDFEIIYKICYLGRTTNEFEFFFFENFSTDDEYSLTLNKVNQQRNEHESSEKERKNEKKRDMNVYNIYVCRWCSTLFNSTHICFYTHLSMHIVVYIYKLHDFPYNISKCYTMSLHNYSILYMYAPARARVWCMRKTERLRDRKTERLRDWESECASESERIWKNRNREYRSVARL